MLDSARCLLASFRPTRMVLCTRDECASHLQWSAWNLFRSVSFPCRAESRTSANRTKKNTRTQRKISTTIKRHLHTSYKRKCKDLIYCCSCIRLFTHINIERHRALTINAVQSGKRYILISLRFVSFLQFQLRLLQTKYRTSLTSSHTRTMHSHCCCPMPPSRSIAFAARHCSLPQTNSFVRDAFLSCAVHTHTTFFEPHNLIHIYAVYERIAPLRTAKRSFRSLSDWYRLFGFKWIERHHDLTCEIV